MKPQFTGQTVLTLVTTMVAVAGLLVGVFQYVTSQKESFRQEYWSRQLAEYQLILEAASDVASSTSLQQSKAARQKFWSVYWGRSALLEHQIVATALTDFARALGECESKQSDECFTSSSGDFVTVLRDLSNELAHCARASLQKTWNPVDLGQRPTCPSRKAGYLPSFRDDRTD